MSSVHCVVVWEFQCGGQWVPHTPGVTRALERAHAKKLTRVVLADADPALNGHYVNLRTLTQSQDMPDGSTAECVVRRSCYSVQSVAARGACWEWARLASPPLPARLCYEPMPMEVQCALEEAWAGGAECVQWGGWAVALAGGLARRGAAVRVVRRAQQPPYPLARTAQPPPVAARPPRARIPQQLTGSSVYSVQSTLSAHSTHSAQSTHSTHSAQSAQPGPPREPPRGGSRSASPRDRKPNLARQILHNLNIFSSKPGGAAEDTAHLTEAEGAAGGAGDAARRHSVDTVSTYLSHESKGSAQRGSVGELLDCSAGSDDVFECPPAAHPPPPPPPHTHPRGRDEPADDDVVDLRALDVGVERCSWVRSVACPQWGALCPVCLQALGAGAGAAGVGAGDAAVSLAGCRHMLHLRCLADQLRAAASAAHHMETVYIECLVCGRAYGAPPLPAPAPAPAPAAQPPGSMAWRLQHTQLPQCSAPTAILVTYTFQSGVQGAGHPAPGAPFYAVGFPRHSLLPDDDLGRQVLSVLRLCWSRGVLFAVRASRTTGREHVVTWRVPPPPPPAAPHHYLPPAHPRAALADLCARLHRLL